MTVCSAVSGLPLRQPVFAMALSYVDLKRFFGFVSVWHCGIWSGLERERRGDSERTLGEKAAPWLTVPLWQAVVLFWLSEHYRVEAGMQKLVWKSLANADRCWPKELRHLYSQ